MSKENKNKNRKSTYKVKIHEWVNGELKTFDNVFETLEQAHEYCNKVSSSRRKSLSHPKVSMKIYNQDDELIHSDTKQFESAY